VAEDFDAQRYIASHVPLGRADLPSASYAEMMEWVLPTEHACAICSA